MPKAGAPMESVMPEAGAAIESVMPEAALMESVLPDCWRMAMELIEEVSAQFTVRCFCRPPILPIPTHYKQIQLRKNFRPGENGDSSSEQRFRKENLISVANFQLRANISSKKTSHPESNKNSTSEQRFTKPATQSADLRKPKPCPPSQ